MKLSTLPTHFVQTEWPEAHSPANGYSEQPAALDATGVRTRIVCLKALDGMTRTVRQYAIAETTDRSSLPASTRIDEAVLVAEYLDYRAPSEDELRAQLDAACRELHLSHTRPGWRA